MDPSSTDFLLASPSFSGSLMVHGVTQLPCPSPTGLLQRARRETRQEEYSINSRAFHQEDQKKKKKILYKVNSSGLRHVLASPLGGRSESGEQGQPLPFLFSGALRTGPTAADAPAPRAGGGRPLRLFLVSSPVNQPNHLGDCSDKPRELQPLLRVKSLTIIQNGWADKVFPR